MAGDPPLTRLTLGAASVTEDLGYVALNDLALALGDVTADYRVIGGHMVTMLAARWHLGHELYRETGDVDLGMPPVAAKDHHVVGRLKGLNYLQVAGNRFARGLSDIPAGMKGSNDSRNPEAFIDILVPAYTSRARENVRVGEDLFTTEVPGLQLALARPAVLISLELRRLNGETLRCELPFADEVSALVLKSLATTVRTKDTDIADIWRCLEIAFAAGLGPEDFTRGRRPGRERGSDPVSLRQPPRRAHGSPCSRAAPLSRNCRRALYPDTGTDRTCTRADMTRRRRSHPTPRLQIAKRHKHSLQPDPAAAQRLGRQPRFYRDVLAAERFAGAVIAA